MNPEPQIPAVLDPSSPPHSTPDPLPPRRKPTGKIANLPKAQRDIINHMLDDGATYKSIEIEMAKHGVSLNGENISNWFERGYQIYLQHQDRIAEARLLRENASDLVQDYNVIQFHQAANQLALAQIFKSLNEDQLIADPVNFVRTLNALARLSRAALVLKQCEDQSAKTLAETALPLSTPDPETQRKLLLSVMERGFGCKAAPGPIGYSLNPNRNLNRNPSESLASSSPELPSEGGSAAPLGPDSPELAPSTPSPCPSSPSSPSSPLPSRPCRSETTDPARIVQDDVSSHASRITHHAPPTPDPRPSEHCLDCRAPLPPLTSDGKRPFDRCENCGIILPPPGLCVRPPNDYCHFCGAALPRRLPNGRRPKPNCHNCGIGLGRELFDEPTSTS